MVDLKDPRGALLALLLAPAALTALAAASTNATDDAARTETAHCIAVMQTHADGLAQRVKAGDKALEPALRTELERAATLIGRTYLDGLRSESEASARLKAARDAQASWPEAQRNLLHAQCVKRADAELASASAAERFVIERVAQSRMRRMLDAP